MSQFQNPSIHDVFGVKASINNFHCHDRDMISVDLRFSDKHGDTAFATVFFDPDANHVARALVEAINAVPQPDVVIETALAQATE